MNSQRFKNLCAMIRLKGRDSHLAHDLEQLTSHGLLIIINGFLFGKILTQHIALLHIMDRLIHEIWIHTRSTVTN